MFYTDFAEDYEQIFPFHDNVFSFLKNYMGNDKGSLLDIGCATGHYCGKFADLGYSPLGIDLDSEMIKTAKKTYGQAKFDVMNLTEIEKIDETFDLVYSTGNVMAHVDEDNLKSFLKSLKNKMKPGSIWIFQVINWDFILTLNEFDFPVIETKSKEFIRKYTEINKNDLIFNTKLKNKLNGEILFSDKVKMYPMASGKYIKIHNELGFSLKGHYSNYSGADFDSSKFSADIYVFSI